MNTENERGPESPDETEVTSLMERFKNGAINVLDFYRTAPVGETIILVCVMLMAVLHDSPHIFRDTSIGIAFAALLSGRPFYIRRQLERCMSDHGFREKDFKGLTGAYCDRQAGRVAARRCGYSDEYQELCARKKAQKKIII